VTSSRYTRALPHAQIFSSIKKDLTMPRPPTDRQRKPRLPLPQDVATAAETKGISPLQYLLRVLNNPRASARRRDRAAVVAARYLHSRPGDSIGKKRQLLEAARAAGGAEWADDLDGSWSQ
jgi:hypothetical protein